MQRLQKLCNARNLEIYGTDADINNFYNDCYEYDYIRSIIEKLTDFFTNHMNKDKDIFYIPVRFNKKYFISFYYNKDNMFNPYCFIETLNPRGTYNKVNIDKLRILKNETTQNAVMISIRDLCEKDLKFGDKTKIKEFANNYDLENLEY